MLWFLFDALATAIFGKLNNAVAFWVVHAIAKHGCLGVFLRRLNRRLKHGTETATVEDIVAKHQAYTIVTDKFLSDDESLRQTVGRGLLCV